MALISLTGITPDVPTSVAVTTKVDGYSISWGAVPSGTVVEVWQGTVNNRASATLVKTVVDSYYDSATLVTGTTYYLWVRAVNAFGIASAFDVGTTSGRSVTVTGIVATQVGRSAGTANVPSVSQSNGSTTATTYNTWVDTGSYIQFTCPSGKGTIAGYCVVGIFVTPGTSNAFPVFAMSRGILYNQTDGIEVPATAVTHCHGVVSSGTLVASTPTATYNVSVDYGFGANALIPGKVYRFKFQTSLQRVAGSGTATMALNYSLQDGFGSTSATY